MNVHKSIVPAALLLLAALGLPRVAFAVQGYGFATISSILTTSQSQISPATGLLYGGCMVNLSIQASQLTGAPNCPNTWVTLGCDGTYTTQSNAQMLLDQAQLAHALNKPIYLVVDDTMLINTFCTAVRIDVE